VARTRPTWRAAAGRARRPDGSADGPDASDRPGGVPLDVLGMLFVTVDEREVRA
jgi:hypothetical protein